MRAQSHANEVPPEDAVAHLDAWQDAFDNHGPAILAFLLSRTRRREDAEDLLQETFVKAIRAEGALRDPAKLRPYLMTIANNVMITSYRRKQPLQFADGGDSAQRVLEQTPAVTEPTDSAALFDDLSRKITSVLENMSPPLRAAFEAAVIRREPYEEIASALGWTQGQVRVNVFRARKRAIELLGDVVSLDGVR